MKNSETSSTHISKNDMKVEKTLCQGCDICEEFTYQRFLTGRCKGEVFKFKYCKQNAPIVGIGNWGPDRNSKTGRVYVCSTRRHDGRARHFEHFLKKDKKNVILHTRDTLDLRLRMLREVSQACKTQTRQGRESIFPGVGLTSWYKNNPSQAAGKKIWWARAKIDGRLEYLGNYYTELESADAYYSTLNQCGRDINKETVAYKTYLNYLQVREFTETVTSLVLDHYHSLENEEGEVALEWYLDLLKQKLKL